MKLPNILVVVLNYNGCKDSKICLTSILKTRYPSFKTIVVDNGSKVDETLELKEKFSDSRLQFIRFKENLGFAGGNNQVIKNSKAPFIVLLNNDTKVEPNWLRELIKTDAQDKNIGAVQAKIRSYFHPDFFEYAGAAGGFIDKLGYPYCRGRIGFHIEEDTGQYDTEVDLFWGSGACLLLKRAALEKCGFLAEEFFFYHEETDLCWRLKNSGFRIVFCPKAVVYHKGASSSGKNSPKKIFFVHRNNLLILARNLSFRQLAWVLPLRFFLDLLSGLFYLFAKKPLFFLSVIKAQISFFCLFPYILKIRLTQLKLSRSAEKDLQPFSIFWRYFVSREHRYTEVFGGSSSTKTMYYEKMLGGK